MQAGNDPSMVCYEEKLLLTNKFYDAWLKEI